MDSRLKQILLSIPKEDIYGFFEYLSPVQQENIFKEVIADPMYAQNYFANTAKTYLDSLAEDEHSEMKNWGLEAGHSGEYKVSDGKDIV